MQIALKRKTVPSGGEAIYFDSLKAISDRFLRITIKYYASWRTRYRSAHGAPYVEHKSKDPAVVVMDEVGRHVISLLSGHLGGANEWTQSISLAIDADLLLQLRRM